MPIVTWAHWKNYPELLMANLPEIYFQVNDSNALKSIACVADVILIAMVSDLRKFSFVCGEGYEIYNAQSSVACLKNRIL